MNASACARPGRPFNRRARQVPPEREILRDGAGEQHHVLEHEPDVLAGARSGPTPGRRCLRRAPRRAARRRSASGAGRASSSRPRCRRPPPRARRSRSGARCREAPRRGAGRPRRPTPSRPPGLRLDMRTRRLGTPEPAAGPPTRSTTVRRTEAPATASGVEVGSASGRAVPSVSTRGVQEREHPLRGNRGRLHHGELRRGVADGQVEALRVLHERRPGPRRSACRRGSRGRPHQRSAATTMRRTPRRWRRAPTPAPARRRNCVCRYVAQLAELPAARRLPPEASWMTAMPEIVSSKFAFRCASAPGRPPSGRSAGPAAGEGDGRRDEHRQTAKVIRVGRR